MEVSAHSGGRCKILEGLGHKCLGGCSRPLEDICSIAPSKSPYRKAIAAPSEFVFAQRQPAPSTHMI
eukprot:10341422-Alexandrium_andersonii.AAC.1